MQTAIRELEGKVSHWEQQYSHAEETISALRVEIDQLVQIRTEKEREIEQLQLAVSANQMFLLYLLFRCAVRILFRCDIFEHSNNSSD